jgi:xanthine/uracil permease
MNEPNKWMANGFASLQWFIFLLASSLSIPIVIGQIFHLSPAEVAHLMQRTFFVVGISSFLQGWLGHRYPLSDGPAGIWLGIFVIMGEMAVDHGGSLKDTLRVLEGGMILCGGFLLIASVLRLLPKMLKVFTPMVTGSYLMMLSLQLSGVFLKGTLGIDEQGHINLLTFGLAFLVFFLVLSLTIWGKGWLKSYAVLIGIGVGWLSFMLVGWHGDGGASREWFQWPEVFAWGSPLFQSGMAVSAVMIALVLISNTVASMAAISQVLGEKEGLDPARLNRAGIMCGVANVLSAVFSTVGMVPLSVAAGFIQMTGQKKKLPYLIACGSIVLVSLIPALISLLVGLPSQIAYATMLASFGQMFGLGIHSVLKEPLNQRRTTILGITLSIGIGLMFLPASIFLAFPSVLRSFLSNGLLIGMVLCILLEQFWREKANCPDVRRV